MSKKTVLLILFLVSVILPASGQKKDSLKVIPAPFHKNVIKLNPTPMMLWNSSNLTFSYERILNPKQSFSVGLGYLVFNPLIKDTIADIFKIGPRGKYGLNFSLEYRFYLSARNARPIPDGLFLAPFFSVYAYHFENALYNINKPAEDIIDLTGGFYAFNVGGVLGYQFVFWKRFTVDLLLIGPAVSYYGGKLSIKGDIDVEEIKDINEEVYDKIIEKYPQIDDILIDKTFVEHGKIDFLSVGYRYAMQLGFHF